MPGSKRKIDEDTWIVSQSKKFKQGITLSSVYETTLAHLRLGARQFFNSLIYSPNPGSVDDMEASTSDQIVTEIPTAQSTSPAQSSSSPPRTASPFNTPPGSPGVRDIISDNELQTVGAVVATPRPAAICQDCVLKARNPLGSEESYGKCAYCENLVCHLNTCRGCASEFCKECCIAKYDELSDAYECYGCLH